MGLQRCEKLVHLTSRVGVARAHGDRNPGLKQGLGLFFLSQPGQQLRELKVARYIIRMILKQSSEMLLRQIGLVIGRTAHRQAVSQKRVVWFGGEKLFELCAS